MLLMLSKIGNQMKEDRGHGDILRARRCVDSALRYVLSVVAYWEVKEKDRSLSPRAQCIVYSGFVCRVGCASGVYGSQGAYTL